MGELRDYILKTTAAERTNGVYPVVVTDGNFFLVRAIQTSAGSTLYSPSKDMIVECVFDDKSSISRRAGEGGNRAYQRVLFKLVEEQEPFGDYTIIVTLGLGQLYSEREDRPKAKSLFTGQFSATPGLSVLSPASIPNGLEEIRLCIPSSQTQGLYFGGSGLTAANGAWLEKGVTEWIDYTGNVHFYNPTGAPILVTYANLLRQDF